MKKWISFGMALLLLLASAGCRSAGTGSGGQRPPSQTSGTAGTAGTSVAAVKTADSAVIQEVSELMNNADLTDGLYRKALVSEGNLARIARAMKKAKSGEPVTVGFIGGSITAGSLASAYNKSYAALVSDWWKCRFPQSRITFVNAGIGATGSMIGVHRVGTDLLVRKPDFVLVEFAVNDSADQQTQEAYESMIRRILLSDNAPGVLLLFMIKQDGTTAQSIQEAVGRHYELPMISYGDALTAGIQAGTITWKDVGGDDTHPNDRGHKLAASMVVRFLNDTFQKLTSIETAAPSVPSPLTANRYMEAGLLTNRDITPASLGGFEVSDNAFWAFKNGWVAKKKKSPLVFKLKAKEVHALVKMTNNGKGGSAMVYVDGQYVTTLDTNFSKGWGEYAASCRLLSEASAAEHTIEFVYIDEKAGDSDGTEFALLGLMVS